jgi:hypothetical protein
MKQRRFGAAVVSLFAALAFAATALAGGNAHATGKGHVKASASVGAKASGKAKGHASTHATVHAKASVTTRAATQAGVKSSSTTGFNTTASAASNQTKLYGNGHTAGGIAVSAGYSGTLFGPGNSQPHKVLCGSKWVDVHALKAHAAACATAKGTASASAQANTNAAAHSATAKAGVKAATKNTASAKTSSSNSTSSSSGVLGGQFSSSGSTGATLPFTGLPLWIALLAATTLVGLGGALRFATRSTH